MGTINSIAWRVKEIASVEDPEIRRFFVRDLLDYTREELIRKLVWKLPPRLIYWATIRAISYATMGKYGSTVVPELSAMDMLGRYGDDHGLHGKQGEG